MKYTWTLFEPWGLGDLAIGLHTVRALHQNGNETAVVCHPAYLDWVKSLEFVSHVITLDVPWTHKSNKYDFRKYQLKNWKEFFKKLSQLKDVQLFDLRQDLRNTVFLKMTCLLSGDRIRLIKQLKSPSEFENRYERGNSFLDQINVRIQKNESIQSAIHPRRIGFFFGAEWMNRRIPSEVAERILIVLKRKRPDLELNVILSPQENPMYSQAIQRSGSIREISKLIGQLDVMVSTDTSWLHIAHLLGIPTFGIFGFRNRQEWLPPGSGFWELSNALPANARYNLEYQSIQPLSQLDPNDFVESLLSWIELKSIHSPEPTIE